MLTTSADRFLAATSKRHPRPRRGLVEQDRRRCRPRRAGTLAIGRARTSRIASVVRMTSSRSAADRTSTSSRWRCRQPTGWLLGCDVDRRDRRPTASARRPRGVTRRGSVTAGARRYAAARSRRRPRRRSPRGGPDELLARGRDVLADVVGPDRQLAMAAVDEHGQADRLRPPEVDEGVHRGADRPARVQDVVDEHDRPPVEVERQVRALDDRLLGDQREVVAVEGDVERADRELDALVLEDRRGEPSGERDAAALDADEHQAVGARPASRRSRGRCGSSPGGSRPRS